MLQGEFVRLENDTECRTVSVEDITFDVEVHPQDPLPILSSTTLKSTPTTSQLSTRCLEGNPILLLAIVASTAVTKGVAGFNMAKSLGGKKIPKFWCNKCQDYTSTVQGAQHTRH